MIRTYLSRAVGRTYLSPDIGSGPETSPDIGTVPTANIRTYFVPISGLILSPDIGSGPKKTREMCANIRTYFLPISGLKISPDIGNAQWGPNKS